MNQKNDGMTGIRAKVSNPLTIIAIFAGIAESSGTIVLPFIAENNQLIYIWFLMFFPTFLVSLFFFTLNRKPSVLYAPSDFRDEENYMKIFQPSSAAQLVQKIREEAEEIEVPERQGEENAPQPSEPPVTSSKVDLLELMMKDRRAKYTVAELLVIDRLEREFRTPGRREMSLQSKFGRHRFDAIFETRNGLRVVEVKFVAEGYPRSLMKRTVLRIGQSLRALPDDVRQHCKAILAVAYDMPEEKVLKVKRELETMLLAVDSSIELRMYPLKELLEELDNK